MFKILNLLSKIFKNVYDHDCKFALKINFLFVEKINEFVQKLI